MCKKPTNDIISYNVRLVNKSPKIILSSGKYLLFFRLFSLLENYSEAATLFIEIFGVNVAVLDVKYLLDKGKTETVALFLM